MNLIVTQERVLGDLTAVKAWVMYEEVFAPINEMAAQRHLMTEAEFKEVAADQRIRKFLAYDHEGHLVGISTITNDLDAWPLISPPYFRLNWPDRYEREAIWYIGFVGARAVEGENVFAALIEAMSPLVFDSDGITAMDFCSYNEDVRQMPRATRALLKRLHPSPWAVEGRQVDTQATWVFRFDGEGV